MVDDCLAQVEFRRFLTQLWKLQYYRSADASQGRPRLDIPLFGDLWDIKQQMCTVELDVPSGCVNKATVNILSATTDAESLWHNQ